MTRRRADRVDGQRAWRRARESGRASGKGAVFRIHADGGWDTVWTSAEDAPYDVRIDESGALLVATGNKGKIYRVSGEPAQATLLARAVGAAGDDDVARRRPRPAAGDGEPGKVFRLSARPATTGTYESEVRDAESLATWGAISWRGTAPAGTEVRALHAIGQHAVGRRHLEPLVRCVPRSRWRTDHQPQGALPPVEDRAAGHGEPEPRA